MWFVGNIETSRMSLSLQQTVTDLRPPQKPCLNPNPALSSPFATITLSSSSSLHFSSDTKKLKLGLNLRCCSTTHFNETLHKYPKPQEIPWRKDLCNTIQLIGVVGVPVELKLLNSGKALAWTRIAVWKSPTDTTWVNLTFWEELAHIAHQHVEKGQRIYVSGRLVADTVEGEDEKQQTYYKVVVQELSFVENNFRAPPSNERETYMIEDRKHAPSANTSGGSTQELWQEFFANPVEWWDNRNNKKNPKAPDFKHKDTGEALWIEGKYNPPWVKSQLAILDSRMGSVSAHESHFGGDSSSYL